jgi:type II secretory pathway pseudopilin PulG
MTAGNRKNITLSGGRSAAFTLIEIVAAITVLALIVSSSLIIINNCLAATVDMKMRMAAFSLARENMEKLLGATAVQESVEYGDSNDIAGITWETRVEPFYEPHTSRMWIQAVSSASWYDAGGQLKTIEFTHWLTDLSQEDIGRILNRQREQQDALDEQMVAEIQDLYQQAVEARDAAGAKGYDDMVAVCRQIIEDYPNTTTANDARSLLRDLPTAEKVNFEITLGEVTPVTATLDTSSGTTASQIDGSEQGTDTGEPAADPASQEKIGGYTWPELDAIYEKDPAEFWRIMMENMFNKK